MRYLYIIILMMLLSGCSFFTPTVEPVIPSTPTDQTVIYITKTLSQTNWLMTLSMLGCGFGVFSLVSGNSKGLNILAGSLTVLFGTLFVASAAAWIAITTKWLIIGSAIGLLICVGLLAYSILVKKKAISEIVNTVEAVKNGWTDDVKKLVNKIQSPTTKAIVTEVKE